jgi:hypothetical protein
MQAWTSHDREVQLAHTYAGLHNFWGVEIQSTCFEGTAVHVMMVAKISHVQTMRELTVCSCQHGTRMRPLQCGLHLETCPLSKLLIKSESIQCQNLPMGRLRLCTHVRQRQALQLHCYCWHWTSSRTTCCTACAAFVCMAQAVSVSAWVCCASVTSCMPACRRSTAYPEQ